MAISIDHQHILRLLLVEAAHPKVEHDHEHHGGGQVPAELQVDERLGAGQRATLLAAPRDVVPVLVAQEAPSRQERGRPQRDAHGHEPGALEDQARRPHQAHREAPRRRDAERRRGQRDGGDALQEQVVLALHARVVRRVEVEQHQLLRECRRGGELGHRVPTRSAGAVQVDGGRGVHEQGERDGRVLEVVEVFGGHGAVGVERLVPRRADDELHEDGRGGAGDDEDELQVARAAHGEPDGRDVGAGTKQEESDVVVEVPQADDEEAQARRDVANERAHGATALGWVSSDGVVHLCLGLRGFQGFKMVRRLGSVYKFLPVKLTCLS
jgi:hypothetical protein